MIAVRLQGRLGNQLFQYAFIYSAAKKLNTNFYLDSYQEVSLIHQYFEIKSNSLKTNFCNSKNIAGGLRRTLNSFLVKLYNLEIKEYVFPEGEADVELKNGILYIGYFQSLLYMLSYENNIRRQLTIKSIFTTEFNRKFDSLYRNNCIITVHIRRSDYKNLGYLQLGSDDLTLPLNYYHKAFADFSEKKNLHYIFISDDTCFIEENFTEIQPKTISTASTIEDFQHLLHSNICVISNSTFSWWGAWLNSRNDKIVYCPKYYLGYQLKEQIPKNIYPKEWRQIEFD